MSTRAPRSVSVIRHPSPSRPDTAAAGPSGAWARPLWARAKSRAQRTIQPSRGLRQAPTRRYPERRGLRSPSRVETSCRTRGASPAAKPTVPALIRALRDEAVGYEAGRALAAIDPGAAAQAEGNNGR
jgi:hypothetical protein